MKNLVFFIGVLFLVQHPGIAQAHKVNLFCHIETGVIHGEAFFSQGAPVKNSVIEVYDLDTNTLIGKTTTDGKGKFSTPTLGTVNIKAVLVASMGHRTEYLITGTETAGEPSPENTVHQAHPPHDDLLTREKQQSGPTAWAIAGGLGLIIGIFSLLYLVRKKNAP